MAFVLPHLAIPLGKSAEAYLTFHTVSIREIEHLTDLDLLPTLEAENLKKAIAAEVWPKS